MSGIKPAPFLFWSWCLTVTIIANIEGFIPFSTVTLVELMFSFMYDRVTIFSDCTFNLKTISAVNTTLVLTVWFCFLVLLYMNLSYFPWKMCFNIWKSLIFLYIVQYSQCRQYSPLLLWFSLWLFYNKSYNSALSFLPSPFSFPPLIYVFILLSFFPPRSVFLFLFYFLFSLLFFSPSPCVFILYWLPPCLFFLNLISFVLPVLRNIAV